MRNKFDMVYYLALFSKWSFICFHQLIQIYLQQFYQNWQQQIQKNLTFHKQIIQNCKATYTQKILCLCFLFGNFNTVDIQSQIIFQSKCMIGSDDDQFNEPINGNVSLNETAFSIHQSNLDQDKDMAALDTCLIRFIRQELQVKFKLDDLEHETIFKDRDYITIPPRPSLYFMPYHILIFDKVLKIDHVRQHIQGLKKEHYSISLYRKSQNLYIKAHSSSQLVFYNLRVIKGDSNLHKSKQMLDQRHLIDKLFEYYSKYYHRIYFQETATLILYWAYQKQLIDEQFNEHILKLLIICNFINFGYGVPNVIHQNTNNKEFVKENNKMYTYSKINQKGETEIDLELKNKYTNYTIQQKRGFYMPSKKKFLNIKDIIPIYFPLVPLPTSKDQKEKGEARKNILAVLNNQKEKMSICKNVYKIFKFLHNKFEKRMKLVVDFEETLAYREEFSEQFQLQVFHPVLSNSICKIQLSSLRKVKAEIDTAYDGFHKNNEPFSVIKGIMSKIRYNR